MEIIEQIHQFQQGLNENQTKQHIKFIENIFIYTKSLEKEESMIISQNYTNKNDILSILKTQEYDVQKSFIVWKDWVQYMMKNKSYQISQFDVENEIKSGGTFFFGEDKQKNITIIIKVKLRFPGKISIQETEKFIIYLLKEGMKRADQIGKSGKIVILWDRQGFTSKNHDRKIADLLKDMGKMLQDVYLARLELFFILYPNLFFRFIFSVYRHFISSKFKEKFKMITEGHQLFEYFDKDQLLVEYGGTQKPDFDYMDIMKSIKTDQNCDNVDSKLSLLIDKDHSEEMQSIPSDHNIISQIYKSDYFNYDNIIKTQTFPSIKSKLHGTSQPIEKFQFLEEQDSPNIDTNLNKNDEFIDQIISVNKIYFSQVLNASKAKNNSK